MNCQKSTIGSRVIFGEINVTNNNNNNLSELTIPFRYFTDAADVQNDAAGTVLVHHSCRRKFVDTRKSTSFEMPRKRLRSSIDNTFDWKTNCFLCTKKAMRKYSTVARVETLPLIQTLIDRCESRGYMGKFCSHSSEFL